MSVIRGLDKVYNTMLSSYNKDSSDVEIAKRKLLTGSTSNVLFYKKRLETQKSMTLQSRFFMKSNEVNISLEIPAISIIDDDYSVLGYFLFYNETNFKEMCLKLLGYLEKCLESKNIVGRFGDLIISFCPFNENLNNYLVGIVNNEIVFMYFISSSRVINVSKISFDNNTLDVILSKGFKKINLSIDISDYSLKR